MDNNTNTSDPDVNYISVRRLRDFWDGIRGRLAVKNSEGRFTFGDDVIFNDKVTFNDMAVFNNNVTINQPPVDSTDAVNKQYVDDNITDTSDCEKLANKARSTDSNLTDELQSDTKYLSAKATDEVFMRKSGGAFTGDVTFNSGVNVNLNGTGTVTSYKNIEMASNAKITGLPGPTAASDATNKSYVDGKFDSIDLTAFERTSNKLKEANVDSSSPLDSDEYYLSDAATNKLFMRKSGGEFTGRVTFKDGLATNQIMSYPDSSEIELYNKIVVNSSLEGGIGIDMSGTTITGVATPTEFSDSSDVTNKGYVDGKIVESLSNVPTPTDSSDPSVAVNKEYVDSLQPWKRTVEPALGGVSYICIEIQEISSCVLAIDSYGDNAFHGMLCIGSGTVSSAVYIGDCDIDTSFDVESDMEDGSRRFVVVKCSTDDYSYPITITCIDGESPINVTVENSDPSGENPNTKHWTDLENGDFVPASTGGVFEGPVVFNEGITVGDINGLVDSSSNIMVHNNVDMDGNIITNVSDPVEPTDVTNKQYVDGLQQWKRTVAFNEDEYHVYIQIPNGGCVLSLDSVGTPDGNEYNAFHGIICIDNKYNISSAAFIGHGGIDTSVPVKTGYDSNTPTIAFDCLSGILGEGQSQDITITCLDGKNPIRVKVDPEEEELNRERSREWTNLKIDTTLFEQVANKAKSTDSDSSLIEALGSDSSYLSGAVTNNLFMPKSGGRFTGPVTFEQNTTFNGGVVTDHIISASGDGITVHSDIIMDERTITVSLPSAPTDVANKGYVDSAIASNESKFVPKVGGTFTGPVTFEQNTTFNGGVVTDHIISASGDGITVHSDIIMDERTITVPSPSASTDAANKQYVDNILINVPDPTQNGHAANKRYVDGQINSVRSDFVPKNGGDFTGRVAFKDGLATNQIMSSPDSSEIGLYNKIVVNSSLEGGIGINMNGTTIAGVATPTESNEVANKGYVDGAITSNESKFVPKLGGSFTGPVTFNNDIIVQDDLKVNTIESINGPDDNININVLNPVNMSGKQIHGVGYPGNDTDAANKYYVDKAIADAGGGGGGGTSTPTNVQINGNSITDSTTNTANIAVDATAGGYNATTNKIATVKYVDNKQLWKKTVTPNPGTKYICINIGTLSDCILAVDSCGVDSFHGLICIGGITDNTVTSAVYVGGSYIDTTYAVRVGADTQDDVCIVFKHVAGSETQSVTITCIAGDNPSNVTVNNNDPLSGREYESKAWTNLESNGGGSGSVNGVKIGTTNISPDGSGIVNIASTGTYYAVTNPIATKDYVVASSTAGASSNPTLATLKVGTTTYNIPSGGGGGSTNPTDVQINGVSITNQNNEANIIVDSSAGSYDATTNKIATVKYVDSKQPWKRTINPPDQNSVYVIFRFDDGLGSVLSLDSVGGNSFHGILCLSDTHDISSAVYVGEGGVNTSASVRFADDGSLDYVAFQCRPQDEQSITITCLEGYAPVNITWSSADPFQGSFYTVYDTKSWTKLVGVQGRTSTISGASNLGSITIDGTSYNIPTGGGGSSPFESGSGTNSAQLVGTNSKAIGSNTVAEGYGAITTGPKIYKNNTTTSSYDTGSIPCPFKEGQVISSSSDGSNPRVIVYIRPNGVFDLNEALPNITTSGGTCYVVNGVAWGANSHVEGYGSFASGNQSHAEGFQTITSGVNSHAEGNGCVAGDNSAHAEGSSTVASGEASHAEGNSTTASSNYSHAEGNETVARNLYAHAEGNDTTASGEASHAEGGDTASIGECSHAEGSSTTAQGDVSHAEGNSTTASGDYSHAEGFGERIESNNTAYRDGNYNGYPKYSIASNGTHSLQVGQLVSSSENGASPRIVVEVPNNKTFVLESALTPDLPSASAAKYYTIFGVSYGEATHTEGYDTIAFNNYEHAEGGYNVSHNGGQAATNTRHSVGIGANNNARANAFEIMENGDAYLKGVGNYNGTAIGNNIQTIQDVIESLKPYIIIGTWDAGTGEWTVDSNTYSQSTVLNKFSSGCPVFIKTSSNVPIEMIVSYDADPDPEFSTAHGTIVFS